MSQPHLQVTALPCLCSLTVLICSVERSFSSVTTAWRPSCSTFSVSWRGLKFLFLTSPPPAIAASWRCSYLYGRCWNFSSSWGLPLHYAAPQRVDPWLKEYTKSLSSSIQAGFLSVWILSKSCRCLSYFLLEFDGIIKGYCCHSKEVCSWSHFLSLLSNVNRLNLTARITKRVHFKTRNSWFLLFQYPWSPFRCHFLSLGISWQQIVHAFFKVNSALEVHPLPNSQA